MESVAKVLSDRNRALLELIAKAKPESLTELAELSGRQKPNLSRTLKTMANYGLVRLQKGKRGQIAPRVAYYYSRNCIELRIRQWHCLARCW